jgi:hypothetical protein
MSDNQNSAGCSVGLGSVLAVVLSVALNHSFWWAVLHFLFGWLYVIYALLVRSAEILPALRRMFGA